MLVQLPPNGVAGSLAIGWINSVDSGDIWLYNDPVGGQVEIVVGDLVVLVLVQVDEIACPASLAMPFLGVTVAVHIVLLPVELNAQAVELHKVHTTHGNRVERFGVATLGAVVWSLVRALVRALVRPL